MTADPARRAREIYMAALRCAPGERTEFLEMACRGDEDLREHAEELLAAHETVSQHIRRPPGADDRDDDTDARDELVGQTVGHFRIRSVIGTGGMGTVFAAIQEQPHRTVALKVMNRGVASRSALRRFQYEAQTLGRMDHPGIARIYDAGMHDDGTGGVPWFAMEYLAGAKSIIKYAEAKKLDARQRLELFVGVCDAVHHGHQKGIIHRDLKPSNILVDAAGRTKIIDFGVARATDSDMAVTTLQTDIGQLIGTPLYMSPEQIEADPHNIDTRSDVYSLSVVLYELIGGRIPYRGELTNPYQLTRTILEQPPRRLSALDTKLRGDIETIVLKGLEKDREQRYQSAAELGQDIRRFLRGDPILARAPSLAYQLRMLVKRHRWRVIAAVTAVAALIAMAFVVVAWSFAVRTGEARDEAESARVEAESARVEAEAATVRAEGAAEEARFQHSRAETIAYGALMNSVEAALEANDGGRAAAMIARAQPEMRGWEWRHLASRADLSLADLDVPGGDVRDVEFSPDGALLAVVFGAPGNLCRLYDAATGATSRDHTHDGDAMTGVAFTHDGALLATSGRDGTIRAWRLDEAPWREPYAICEMENVRIDGIAFHPHQRILVSRHDQFQEEEAVVRLWDLRSLGETINARPQRVTTSVPLRGHDWQVLALAFSPDGRVLATASRDRSIRLWDVEASLAGGSAPDARGGEELARLWGHRYYIHSLAFSPDGSRLASGSMDRTVRIWDVPASLDEARRAAASPSTWRGVELDVLYGHEEGVQAVAFEPDGGRLYSGGGDTTIRVWQMNEADLLEDYRGEQQWSVATRREAARLRGHEGSIRDIDVSPSGLVACGSRDGAVKLWSPHVADIQILRAHRTSVLAVAFDPGGRYAYSNSSVPDCSLFVWDVERGHLAARSYVRDYEGFNDIDCTATPEGTLVAGATGVQPGTARVILWRGADPLALEVVAEIEPDPELRAAFIKVALSADGRRVAAGSNDGLLLVWDASRLPETRLLATLRGHVETISSVRFLDDSGRYLVSASGHTRVASGGSDTSMRVWDVETGREIQRLTEHDHVVVDLAVNADRTMLATASMDETVRLWRIVDGPPPRLESHATLEGHTHGVYSVVFHPTEPRLATGSRDRTIKLWDTRTHAEVVTLRGHAGFVNDLAFDPQGERLVSASFGFEGTDNYVRLWETHRDRALVERRAVTSQAERLARRLLEHPIMPEEGHRQIDQEPSISAEVREEAHRCFDILWPEPVILNFWGAWSMAVSPPSDEMLERVVRWTETALRLQPYYEDARVTLARAQAMRGRDDEALAVLVDSPEPGALNLILRGLIVAGEAGQDAGEYAAAIDWARQGLAMVAAGDDGARSAGLLALGASLFRAGRYEEALSALEESVALVDDPAARAFLAMTQHRRGEAGAAGDALERARALIERPEFATDRIARERVEEAERLLGEGD